MFQTSDLLTVIMHVFLFFLVPTAFAQPACDAHFRLFLDHTYFQICYDPALKAPVWTRYELRPEHLAASAPRSSAFRRDPLLASPSASNADFRLSGFSRGHLIPAADFAWSEPAFSATFILSNVVAQRQSVNAGLWRKLENAVRRIAAASDSVSIFTGPLFGSANLEYIGPGRVAVPTHTYKVILAVKGKHMPMFAAIIPNEVSLAGPINRFAVTVDEVERRSGLDFFSALDDATEDSLEAAVELFPEKQVSPR